MFKTTLGETPLMLAAINNQLFDLAKVLIARGADVNRMRKSGLDATYITQTHQTRPPLNLQR